MVENEADTSSGFHINREGNRGRGKRRGRGRRKKRINKGDDDDTGSEVSEVKRPMSSAIPSQACLDRSSFPDGHTA